MGFRFWSRSAGLPNLGMRLTKGPRRRPRGSQAIPGIGLFYKLRSGQADPKALQRVRDRLTLGFFQRLITPAAEEALIDGCRQLVAGHEAKAAEYLTRAVHLADGAFLAGMLALKRGHLDQAHQFLLLAFRQDGQLGRHFAKYGIDAELTLPITEDVVAVVRPDLRGVLLGLVEACQRLRRWDDAIAFLHRLLQMAPDDIVIKVSLAEVLLEAAGSNEMALGTVIQLSENVTNASPVHTALLLYKAQALRRLGLLIPAQNCLTELLRQKKGRSVGLLRALRYERALVFEALGQRRRAVTELEKLYSESPHYEDVAERLIRLRTDQPPTTEKAA